MEQKKYNFDQIIDRHHTSCLKYDMMGCNFGREDLMPLWIADMDFASPDFVFEALRKRMEHPVLGYTFGSDSYFEAIQQWLLKHYSITARKEELHFIPGIVAGIAFTLQAFTKENDAVLIMTPVYPPFSLLPNHGKRELRCNKLKTVSGQFAIDFEDLDKQLKGTKVLILCNPHNPGGRVWSPEELKGIAQLCAKHHVLVISDEIHADLTLPPHRHTSFPTCCKEAEALSITFMAPSKTFNIAGMASSVAYVPNPELRKAFFGYIDGYELANGNVFAYTAAEAAFRHGEEWLRQALEYLQGNIDYAIESLHRHLPMVNVMRPQASFLLWMDFKATGLCHDEVKKRLLSDAHLALNDGTTFGGDDYACCFRMNIGCPRSVLEEALQRLYAAFSDK
ncbi:MAG: PatB family C-S lyase [Bacteroidales bacterium]|nr:PatB family C-S lyase [Bacteroidales bacterium]